MIESSSLAVLVGIGVTVLIAIGPSRSLPMNRVAAQHSRNIAGGVTAVKEVPTTESTTTSTTNPTSNPDEMTGLFATAAIGGYLQTQDSDINAAVYNLDTGQLSLYRPGAVEYTASIVKVDILATLLHQSEQQGTGLNDEEQDLATTMIENSDDDAATDLWDDIGQQTGLAGFDSLIPLPDTVPGADGYWGETTTTGADQVDLLREPGAAQQLARAVGAVLRAGTDGERGVGPGVGRERRGAGWGYRRAQERVVAARRQRRLAGEQHWLGRRRGP